MRDAGLMQNQIRRFVIGDLLFVGAMILLAQVLLLVGASPAVAVLPTLLLGTVALIVLLSVLLRHRRSLPIVQRIIAGEHWVAWHYPAGEWRRLVSDERVRANTDEEQITVAGLAGNVLLYSVSAAAAGYFIGIFGRSTPQAIQIALIMGGVVLAVSLFFAINSYRQAQTPPPATAVDVYLGSLGIYLPGRYITFDDPHLTLADVQVVPGSPALLLVTTRLITTYHRAIQQKLAIPIPEDHIAEAQALADRFQAEMVIRDL